MILHVDSDDIKGLSTALAKALSRRGIVIGETPFDDYDEDEIEDIDPYLGIMPNRPMKYTVQHGGCGSGGCGGYEGYSTVPRHGSCGGGGSVYGACGSGC